MATQFDVFDVYPHQIRLVTDAESGYYDQTTSLWTNATPTATVIVGHLTTPNREEDETAYRDRGVGPLEDGDLDFYTETAVAKGNILEVDQNDTVGDTVRKYRILAVTKKHNIIAHHTGKPARYQAHLREVPQ